MANGTPPTCGWQVPGNVPGAFDWALFAALATAAAAVGYVYAEGIPIISGILGQLVASGAVTGIGIASAAAGALAVLALVAYYLLRPDGCVRSKPKSESICCSGIVEQITDLTSAAVQWLAPFAIGPSFMFDVVVKTPYIFLATQGAEFVICSEAGAPMLRCIVKSEISCGARIGATVGAAVGAIAGIIVGYLAGVAVASLACGPLAWLCFIVAMIVALIVAAAITYGGAMLGGYAGAGIAAIGEDAVEEAAGSLVAGTIVTVRGDWTKNPDYGYNELFYVTALNRTDDFGTPPSYTNADADSTPADDCPLVPPAPG